MKRLAGAAAFVAIVLAASGCASGRPAGNTSLGSLPAPVRKHAGSLIRSVRATPDDSVSSIEVYGPGSRTALVKASSGDVVESTPGRFYLFVLHGSFICTDCSGPAGSKPPHGTVETYVWSPTAGGTDFGIGPSVPSTVAGLPRLVDFVLGSR